MPINSELSGDRAVRAMLRGEGYLVVEQSHERVVAFLTDYAADCSARTRNLLRTSVQLGVHRELRRAGPHVPFTVIRRCTTKLMDEGGLHQTAVEEVLDAWLTAFRFTSAKEEPTTVTPPQTPAPTIPTPIVNDPPVTPVRQSHWLRDLIGVGIFAVVYVLVRMTFR